MCCGKSETKKDREVRRAIQGDSGEVEQLARGLVQDVASALDVHPFMLSLWRKQVREGIIVARASKLDVETTAELRRLRELERRYKVLKEEHELLKKAIRFASDRKRKSSPSSK